MPNYITDFNSKYVVEVIPISKDARNNEGMKCC